MINTNKELIGLIYRVIEKKIKEGNPTAKGDNYFSVGADEYSTFENQIGIYKKERLTKAPKRLFGFRIGLKETIFTSWVLYYKDVTAEITEKEAQEKIGEFKRLHREVQEKELVQDSRS